MCDFNSDFRFITVLSSQMSSHMLQDVNEELQVQLPVDTSVELVCLCC